MNPLFCRIGNKYQSADQIIRFFPHHTTYVEPFVGSGAVYFKKPKINNEVLNDIDTELMNSYKLINSLCDLDFNELRKLKTLEQKQLFMDKEDMNEAEQLYKYILKSCNTYSSTGVGKLFKNYSHFKKLVHFEKYKERLLGTILLNEDYKEVIKKYDSINTLFYLDPPYEPTRGIYDNNIIDFEDLERFIRNLEGYVCLSLNDSPLIREIFKNYYIVSINEDRYRMINVSTSRKDILIMNWSVF